MLKAQIIDIESHQKDRPRLIALIEKLCLVRGDVVLASGKKSNYLFDMKPLMMDPEAIRCAASALVEKIPDNTDYIGGLEMGAVPLTTAILTLHTKNKWKGFFVRKHSKGHGLKKLIEGLEAGINLKGKNITLIEDVTTTGGSALKAVKIIQDEGGIVKTVITLLDRKEGAAENFAKEGIELKACLTTSDIIK